MAHHHHGHSRHDSSGRRDQGRGRLALVLVLVLAYMVAEIVGGLLTNSLALLADAGHMFSDAVALALSLFAAWMASRPSGTQRTYGFYRSEVLAALVNGAALLAVGGYICYEALSRLGQPPEVNGLPMLVVAVGGLAVNLLGLMLLGSGRKENLNVRGAWLHVLSDALGSIGAIVAGALIWAFEWNWADPLASMVIALLVVFASWSLLRESVNVLMEAAPPDLDVEHIEESLLSLEGVEEVHDLHVWTITSGLPALSVHVVVQESDFRQETLRRVASHLVDRFGLDHCTIQLEAAGFDEPVTVF